LKHYGFEDADYWHSILMLVIMCVACRLLVIGNLYVQDQNMGSSKNDTRNTAKIPEKVPEK